MAGRVAGILVFLAIDQQVADLKRSEDAAQEVSSADSASAASSEAIRLQAMAVRITGRLWRVCVS